MGRLLAELRECGAALQVALDLTDLRQALALAASMPESRALFLEAGTPLIKAWGGTAIRALRSLRPESVLVADTKTADAAGIEAEIAKEAGADAFTVLAYAGEEALASAAEAARSLGMAVYGDSIWMNPLEVAERLRRAGVHIALIHVGVDAQARSGARAAALKSVISQLSEAFGGFIAIAGGLKPGDVEDVVRAGASIAIIGSAITRADSPRREAERALESLWRAGARCR